VSRFRIPITDPFLIILAVALLTAILRRQWIGVALERRLLEPIHSNKKHQPVERKMTVVIMRPFRKLRIG
jgi:hypothetical protein